MSSAPKALSLSVCLPAPSACPRLPAHVCLPRLSARLQVFVLHSNRALTQQTLFFLLSFFVDCSKIILLPIVHNPSHRNKKTSISEQDNKDHHSITQHTQPCPIQNAEMTTTCRCPRVYHLSRTIITTPYSFLVWMTDWPTNTNLNGTFSIIATVQKLINEMMPDDIACAKDTRDLLIECCVGKEPPRA